MTDLSAWREEFSILSSRTYLISASLGPLSRRARAAAEEHLDLWSRFGPEEFWFEHAFPKLQECRELFARLIGADADEVAIVPSVSIGMSSIASCLDLGERPKVVLTAMDFPTNHYVWRAQVRRGAELQVVPSDDGITIDEAKVVEAIDEQTAIVNINRVLFESSHIIDLEPIVNRARQTGTLTVVDDFHGTAIVPIDVKALGIDFLVTGVLKWVCGGQGLALLYCRRELTQKMEPLNAGWFGTEDPFMFNREELKLRPDARRFETGTYALPQAWTAAAAMNLIFEVGVDVIRKRNQELTTEIIDQADGLGLEVLSPREPDQRGGLVRLKIKGGSEEAEKVMHRLFEADVVVDRRGDALRISPHFFNTEADIDRCFEELARQL